MVNAIIELSKCLQRDHTSFLPEKHAMKIMRYFAKETTECLTGCIAHGMTVGCGCVIRRRLQINAIFFAALMHIICSSMR